MKRNQIHSLVLALVLLIALFSGCSNDNAAPSASPDSPAVSAPSENPDVTASGGDTSLSYPIPGEKTTFDVWTAGFNSSNKYGYTTWNDYPAYQELEKRTNVHIEWMLPADTADAQASFSLVIASQDYPDSFQGGMNYYTGGMDSYIQNEIIVDIKDLVGEYCPDYTRYYSSDEEFKKGFVTDSGTMPGFFAIMKEKEGSWIGPVIRADLYDKFGLPDPVTLDDLHDSLALMKKEYNLDGPLLFNQQGFLQFILAAWNIEAKFYVVDNTVKYGVVQREFKEYIEMMSKWYAEGLIDRDFTSKVTMWYHPDYMTSVVSDEYVYFDAFYGAFDGIYASAENPNYKLRPVSVPVLAEGQQRLIRDHSAHDVSRIRNSVGTITTACENPAILSRWYNYMYTDDGFLLANYGTDENHDIDENGKPQYNNDLLTKLPDGFTVMDAVNQIRMPVGVVQIYDWSHQLLPTLKPEASGANQVWDANYTEKRTMPSRVSLTAEESSAYSAITTDLDTFISENVVKFILGQKSMDEYDAFIEQIHAMGLEEMIAYQQAALDRYNAR